MTNLNTLSQGSCSQMPPEEAERYWLAERGKGKRARQEMAKRICNNCVVVDECLSYALEHDVDGIWGGMTKDERFNLRGDAS